MIFLLDLKFLTFFDRRSCSMLPWESKFDSNKVFWMKEVLHKLLYKKEVIEFKGSVFWRMRHLRTSHYTKKMKFSIKNFSSKCDQICSFPRIWSHLPDKSLTETSFFVQCPGILWSENSDIIRITN